MCIGLHLKCPLFRSDFNKTSIYLTFFRKKAITKFSENPSIGSRFVSYKRAGGRTDIYDEVKSLFFNYAQASKNHECLNSSSY